MPLPLLIIGACVGVAGWGVKKHIDANEMSDEADEIVKKSKNRLETSTKNINSKLTKINHELLELDNLKISTFKNQVKFLVDVLKKCQTEDTKARLKKFNYTISPERIQAIAAQVKDVFNASDAAGGIIGGSVIAGSAFFTAQGAATASTLTSLSMALGLESATGATLSYLGAGTVAAGAGVVAGLAIAPIVCLTGYSRASNAEEKLTGAKKYQAEVNIAIEKMKQSDIQINATHKAIYELTEVINHLVSIFDQIKVHDDSNIDAFVKMFKVGEALVTCLNMPIFKDNAVNNIKVQTDGYMEI